MPSHGRASVSPTVPAVQTMGVTAEVIFRQIVAGEVPAPVINEDDLTVAFLDQAPATEGHTLVVPRSHATDIWELSDRDAIAVMLLAKRVAHLFEERLSPDGLNLVQANRLAAWQSVFHFHLHVVPRWSGDGLRPPWNADRPPSDNLTATLDHLR